MLYNNSILEKEQPKIPMILMPILTTTIRLDFVQIKNKTRLSLNFTVTNPGVFMDCIPSFEIHKISVFLDILPLSRDMCLVI